MKNLNVVSLMDLRRERAGMAALPWMPRAFRPQPDPRSVPRAHPAPHVSVIRFALLALVLGAMILWATPAEAEAQETEPVVLVKNTGQTTSTGRSLTSTNSEYAQAFTTGPNPEGYRLSSIGIGLFTVQSTSTAGGQLIVSLHANDNGNPGDALCALRDPTSFTSGAVNTFVVPATCPRLASNTTYLVRIQRNVVNADVIKVSTTASSSEDSGGASGWSIRNNGRRTDSGTWQSSTTQQIEVSGTAIESEPVEPDEPVELLVKNTGQTATAPFFLPDKLAQAFTTGANTAGYKLSGVGFFFNAISDTSTAGATLLVTLHADDNGNPGDVLCTLSDPASFAAAAVNTFDAPPACPTLVPNTTYFAVLERDSLSLADTISLRSTLSPSEDAGGLADWSIANKRHSFESGQPWDSTNGSILIEVRGAVAEPPVLEAGERVFLVENTGQPDGDAYFVAKIIDKRAQAFTTGSLPSGYKLGSIGIDFGRISSMGTAHRDVRVTLNRDFDNPGEVLCTLGDPPHFHRNQMNTFVAPTTGTGACPTLDKETTYWVVVDWNLAANPEGGIYLQATNSDSDDGGSTRGWSIADTGRRYRDDTKAWSETTYSYKIRVAGIAFDGVDSPAGGAPTISGTAEVDHMLTARTSTIWDPNGLTTATYSYQWILHNGRNEHKIGTDSPTYTPIFIDGGKRIKVRVTFTDDAGHEQTLTSRSVGPVAPRGTTPVPVARFQSEDLNDGPKGSFQKVIDAASTETPEVVPGSVEKVISSTDTETPQPQSPEVVPGSVEKVISSTDTETPQPQSSDAVLTASFDKVPANHDGQTAFTFELHFSEEFGISYLTLRDDDAFTVTDGEVTGARRLTQGSNIGWTVTVTPDSGADVTVVLPVTTDCTATGAICTGDGTKLSAQLSLSVPGPVAPKPNSAATGAPAVSGTAQVDETLTASTSDIDDADGLTGAVFGYQWIRSADGADTDIAGATGSSYTLASEDEGKTVKVRVSFTDDGGNSETLISAPTETVAPVALTASFQSAPSTHDGQTAFTFELHFSEEFGISYLILRDDDAFTVTDGEVTGARRLTQGSNIGWTVTVTPDSGADVTVVLPVTADCSATGAVCTGDGRKLSNRLEFTVTGPQ